MSRRTPLSGVSHTAALLISPLHCRSGRETRSIGSSEPAEPSRIECHV